MKRIAILALLQVGCGVSAVGLQPIDFDSGSAPEAAAAVSAEAKPEAALEAGTPEADAAAEAGEPEAEASVFDVSLSLPMKTFPDAGIPEADIPEGCVIVTHDNGLGRTWQDCTPLGDRSQREALQACGSNNCTYTDGYGGVCTGAGSPMCTCWDPDGHIRGGSWPSNGTCSVTALATQNVWQ